MCLRTDDPIADLYRWETDKEERLKAYPICERCGEHIVEDDLYDIDDTLICEHCVDDYIEENFKQPTNLYMRAAE